MPISNQTAENALYADIERLREPFPQTQDLYREVCMLMFFRYGMTPTANKLYQLVRKGSMSAPAEALTKFWENLREKSRVRIEHPDLPESLKTAAGELAATLWSSAQALAHEALAAHQGEAQAAVAQAEAQCALAQAERKACQGQLEDAMRLSDVAHQRIGALQQDLAATAATNAGFELQLQQAKQDNVAHLEQIQDARREFTFELDKLRAATQSAEERFQAGETRALLEIDRERTAAAKLQKELDAVRASASQIVERHRSELAGLQVQLGDHRQKSGVVEGHLQAVTANRDLAIDELKTTQRQLAEAITHAYSARIETENWRRQTEEAQRMLAELRKVAKPARIARKAKTEI